MEEIEDDNAQKEKKGGMFSHEKEKEPEKGDITTEVNTLGRRLRVLEEQYTNLRRKIQVTEQNMLRYHKKNASEFKTLNLELNDLRQMLDELDNKSLLIIKELKLCAKKEDVDVLQKYIDMWEPIRFVTRNEVERIVKEIIDDSLRERKV